MNLPHIAYTAFMLLALVVFLLARRLMPRIAAVDALPWTTRALLALAAFIGGALGAKLPFALAASNPLTLDAWLADGKTVTTGLMGGYLGVEIAKRLLGVKVRTGDSFALPLALALAVGRWGCFCNGCCYGVETSVPWAVPFHLGDGRTTWRHPTQIYESAFHLIMALVLMEVMRRGWFVGNRLKLYLICYGIFRFLTEFIRPEPVVGMGLTFYQWAALTLSAALAVQWAVERPPPKAQPA
jgi:phosphatidylglycerol:prolipoprotein diacylglycerol transferase